MKVFTIHGHSDHIGHVTWTIFMYINFLSPFPRRLHKELGSDWFQKRCLKIMAINMYLAKIMVIQLLKAYRIKFQKFAAHALKDALINETFIPT